MFKAVIGSASKRKIESARVVLVDFLGEDFDIQGCGSQSGVPETPFDKETFDGAVNRAQDAKRLLPGGDLYIGLESGLIERYGHIYEETWAVALKSDGSEFYGYSSGLKVPDRITQQMKELNMTHQELMIKLEEELGLENDTWANYSGGAILRTISLEEALRNALVQAFPKEKSFYKLK